MIGRQPWSSNHKACSRCMDDTQLVAGLKQGDPEAVEYAVLQYAPALYRFAIYQLHDPIAAEDLVSEVVVRMIRGIDEFVLGRASFQAWLFRIARNLIADHYRAGKRRPQVSLEALLDEEPGWEPGQYDVQIDLISERDRLQAGLDALTEEQRQVILLHLVEGWELPQVAQLMDRTLPSVKSLYYRGVQSLRRVLMHLDRNTEDTRG
jgi:RNA polymerase sigma-70 factor, ECF subfamily